MAHLRRHENIAVTPRHSVAAVCQRAVAGQRMRQNIAGLERRQRCVLGTAEETAQLQWIRRLGELAVETH